MNERINILAEQAGLHCDGTPDCWDQEAIARFAQLIVRECIDTAFHHGHPDLEFLLEHFGVES